MAENRASEEIENADDKEQTHDMANRFRNRASLFVLATWTLGNHVAPDQEVLKVVMIIKVVMMRIMTRAVDRILKSRIKSDLKSRIKSDLSDFLTGRKPLLLWSF